MRTQISLAIVATLALAAPAFAAFTPYLDPNCASESESDCTRMLVILPTFSGWHREEDATKLFGATIIVPDGVTYDQAKVWIMVRSTPKIEVEYSVKKAADMVKNERDNAELSYPGTTFADAGALRTGDGQTLRSQTSAPPADDEHKIWSRYAYGVEGDYYLTFMLNAASQAELDAAMKDFERLVAAYRAKLK